MPDLDEVFISYSWDNEAHVAAVLALSNRLRGDGIDCVLDQYEVSPPEGWPRWMNNKIASASLVLVVCTKIYQSRIDGEDTSDGGLGVKWEGPIVYQHLYNFGGKNTKFIPVLTLESDSKFIPIPLQGATRFVVDTEAGYQRLYNRLLGRAPAEKPPLGKRAPLASMPVKTDPVVYFSTPIDVDLWNQAKWTAVAFLWGEKDIPIMALAFRNKEATTKIFQQWHRRYGDQDKFDELRVSIIEGDIPGKEPGYSVHIGVDWDNLDKRFEKAGFTPPKPSDPFISISRLHRMNPEPGSTNLASFKAAYRQFGAYYLAAAVCDKDGSNLEISFNSTILKKQLYLRNGKDIARNDVDYAIFMD